MATTTKRRRRRRAAAQEPPAERPDALEAFETALADALTSQKATGRERDKIDHHASIADDRQAMRRNQALEERAATLPQWQARVAKVKEEAQIAHRLDGGHRGPAPKTPDEKALEDFIAELEQSREEVRNIMEHLPGTVGRLLADLRTLESRLGIVPKQHTAIEKAEAAAAEFLDQMIQASGLQDDYETILREAKYFTVPGAHAEIIRTNPIDFRHDGDGIRGFIAFFRQVIAAERERLRVRGLHLRGELSEKEKLERERAERYTYSQQLQSAAKSFRATKGGAEAWKRFKQIAAAYNAAGEPLSESHQNAKKMMQQAIRVFYSAVCEHADMEVRPEWFPELA